MKRILLQGCMFVMMVVIMSSSCGNPKEMKWSSFEKIAKYRGEKMVFIELHTSWCGWCQRMENYTFNDPVVSKYMNKNFYNIKFNAEDRRPVQFLNKTYRFDPADTRRGRHELAAALMLESEKQGYPTVIFLDENHNLLQAIPGYITARDFEAMMHYFGDGAYKTTKWEDFKKKYQIEDYKSSDPDDEASN